MGDAADDLARLWRWFAEQQFRGYSPIYERIAEAVAADRGVLELFMSAPPAAHLPPAPLGAVRYLLLDGLDHPLAAVYDGRSTADPAPLFLDLCRTERDDLLTLLETRRVQTNDCGRSALIGPALLWVAEHLSGPYCLVDVGASAGINLLCDSYRLDYGRHGATGPADSPVQVACAVTGGAPPVADRLPTLLERVGIDLSPLDLTSPSDARWLLACVWPDTGRSERVEASIRLLQQDPPTLLAGHANELVPGVLDALPAGATAIVVTTWAYSYFSLDERATFVELLAAASARRPIAWVSADLAGVVEALGVPDPQNPTAKGDVLGAVLLREGAMDPHLLAFVHPHGSSIDWRTP